MLIIQRYLQGNSCSPCRGKIKYSIGRVGVQGQGKGQWVKGMKVVNDYIGLATCQSKIYEK